MCDCKIIFIYYIQLYGIISKYFHFAKRIFHIGITNT